MSRSNHDKSIYDLLTEQEREALNKAREKMRLVRLAYRTQGTYLSRIAGYMVFIRTKLHPGLSRKERIEAYLSDFAKRRRAAATQNQAYSAVKFFFEKVYEIPMEKVMPDRARVTRRIRIPPERTDILKLLEAMENTVNCHYRTMAYLMYGRGLRITETVRIRRRDLLVAHSSLVIRQGKGDKDRILSIPCNLMPALLRQLEICDRVWEVDSHNKIPVPLPDSLAVKYPANPFKRDWAWLFPSVSTCIWEGRTMRHHISQQSVREALTAACAKSGVDRISPHYLRHGFGSDFQGDIQELQKILGHASIETTMGYRHLRRLEHMSPIDGLLVR